VAVKRYENNAALRRQKRVRAKVKSSGRLRISIFRSSRNIYAQIIDDAAGKTLVSASSLDKSIDNGGGRVGAEAVGKLLAERATKKKLSELAFDRGSYPYHGRVQALAEAARAAGLKF